MTCENGAFTVANDRDSEIRIAGWIARSAVSASLNACAGSTRAGSSHPVRYTRSRAKAPPEAAFAKGDNGFTGGFPVTRSSSAREA